METVNRPQRILLLKTTLWLLILAGLWPVFLTEGSELNKGVFVVADIRWRIPRLLPPCHNLSQDASTVEQEEWDPWSV